MGKNAVLFLIGGGAYVLLELLFRGRSHWTMFVLGGLCFLLIGLMGRRFPKRWIPAQILLGAAIITAGELLFGLVFNSGYTIWDYRNLPLNYRGQICLNFGLLWIPISFLAAVVFEWLDGLLSRRL